MPLDALSVPGVDECTIFRGRIGLRDVHQFLVEQLRVFYARHGHTGTMLSVVPRLWDATDIADEESCRRLPAADAFTESYGRMRALSSARTMLSQRAGEFCIAIVAHGQQDNAGREREEIVTRIFDYTLLQDSVTGFTGPFENPKREYWVLSRNWTKDDARKYDYNASTNITMATFYQRWLIHRDMALQTAQRRLEERTADNIERLYKNL